ncbi:MAG: PDZ domain-containing protein [Deltaproteobacteria bacterium]|nr:MAG: PDZ domain-containing protein [Deltaproteobacteria bacterium]
MARIGWIAAGIAALGLAAGTAFAKKDKDDPGGAHAVVEMFAAGDSGQLGVEVTSMTRELRKHFGAPADAGILVSRVEPNSPAARAGVRVGDVIVAVAGKNIDTPWDVWKALSGRRKGDKVAVVVVRDGKRRALTATLQRDAVDVDKAMGAMGMGPMTKMGPGRFRFDFDGDGPGMMWFGRAFGADPDGRIDKLERRIAELEAKLCKLDKKLCD